MISSGRCYLRQNKKSTPEPDDAGYSTLMSEEKKMDYAVRLKAAAGGITARFQKARKYG